MVNLVRYDSFRDLFSFHVAANRLFEQGFVGPNWSVTNATLAPIDVLENELRYQVRVQQPCVKPKDIDLTVRGNSLTVKGQYHSETKEDKKGNWLVKETRSGSFGRSVTFAKSIDADKIETSYEQGVLTISVPVNEVARPKKISLKKDEPKAVAEEAGSTH
jgi:HSP20 family protein